MKPAVKMPKTKYTYLQRDVIWYSQGPILPIYLSAPSSSRTFHLGFCQCNHLGLTFVGQRCVIVLEKTYWFSIHISYCTRCCPIYWYWEKSIKYRFLYMFDVQYQKYAKPSQSFKKSWQGIITRQVIVRWCSKMPWVDEQRLQIASILWIQSAS